MTSRRRTPDTCAFRKRVGSPGTFEWHCELTCRFAGTATPSSVDRAVCDACCEHPLPPHARLNPIVASLVCAAAEHDLKGPSLDAGRRIALWQARQFAIRWLASGDGRRVLAAGSSNPCGHGRTSRDMRAHFADGNGLTGAGSQPLRIGLAGSNSRFGLGHQNRDIARHLNVERWLVRSRGDDADPRQDAPPCRVDVVPRDLSPIELEAWVDGLDLVLFVERPAFAALPGVARSCGARVVCVPNWEWLHAGLEWLDDVDLMLCPTRHTAAMLSQWRRQFRFGWEIAYIPWPIDVERFQYRRRWLCRRFVFVNGSGGVSTLPRAGSASAYQRKGWAVLLAAARLAPRVPILAYASPRDGLRLPPNVELRPPPADNRGLYGAGDVCVQPSYWEGLGLPLLECQAAGMPLVTTDAPPMNEHCPLDVVPAAVEAVHLTAEICISAATVEPEALAQVLRRLHGRVIMAGSRRARKFIVREHNWRTAAPKILRRLASMVYGDGACDAGDWLAPDALPGERASPCQAL